MAFGWGVIGQLNLYYNDIPALLLCIWKQPKGRLLSRYFLKAMLQ